MKQLRFWVALLTAVMGSLQAQANEQGFYVYFKKPADWPDVYLYTWLDQLDEESSGEAVVEPMGPWPGKKLRSDSIWHSQFLTPQQLDATGATNLIFHSATGVQTQDLRRSKNGWFRLQIEGSAGSGQWFDADPENPFYRLQVIGGSGSGDYRKGSLIPVKAEVNGALDIFLGWQSSHPELLQDEQSTSTQFTMPAENARLEASFLDIRPGQELYQQQCANCHGGDGSGGFGPSLLAGDGKCKSCGSQQNLLAAIVETMPLGGAARCVGSDIGTCARDVADYIFYGLNQNKSEPQCEPVAESLLPRRVRLLTKGEYWSTVGSLLDISIDFPADVFWPEPSLVDGYDNNSDQGVVSDRHLLAFLELTQTLSPYLTIQRLVPESCQQDYGCFLESFGLRAWRRPLSAEEKQQYLGLVADNESFASNVARLAKTMLLSPNFLYRSEMGRWDATAKRYQLDDYEIASAISYALTGGMPDQILLQAAAAGRLADPVERQAQARRLLKSSDARQAIAEFSLQWMQVKRLLSASRNTERLTASIRQDMLDETAKFFVHQFIDRGDSFENLYLADYSFGSSQLAAFYGLPSDAEGRILYQGKRSGLLGHGSFLASYALANESSPIKRGVFVRNRLLCQDLPPPPDNVDTTIPPPLPGQTIRERLKRHLSQGDGPDGTNSCASCHQYIDSIGFGFESFNRLGEYRAVYQELDNAPVDATGYVSSLETLGDGSRYDFETLPELAMILANSEVAKRCVTQQYFQYSLGTDFQSKRDRCSVQSVFDTFKDSGFRLDALLVAMVANPYFIYRQ